MPRSLRWIALALLAPVFTACTSVTFESQDARLDRDLERDTLTIELDYHDIGAVDSKRGVILGWGTKPGPNLTAATTFLEGLARGRRIFILAFPYGDWDLDGLAADDAVDADLRAYLSRVYVDEARVELGAEGEINAYQRIVFPDATAGLALVNQIMRREIGESLIAARKHSKPGSLEADSFAVAAADILTERDWITWGEDGLTLTIPITSKHLVGILRNEASNDLVAELRRGLPLGEDDLAGLEGLQAGARILLDNVSDFRIESDHLVLVLGDESGNLAAHFGSELFPGIEDFRPALREHLEATDFEFP
jgi:hypothetical protein